MTPMAMPTPSPTLQPTDAYVIYLSVFVSVSVLLCGCIVCSIVCCCCALWIKYRRMRRNYMQEGEHAPLLGDDKRIPVTPENAGDDQPEPDLRNASMAPQQQQEQQEGERAPLLNAYQHETVDKSIPLIQNKEQPPKDVIKPEGAGAGRDGHGMKRYRPSSTAGVVQFPNNDRQQSAIGGMEEWSTSRAAESQQKDLCLIPSGVDQLTIYTTQSRFRLGNGDATLIVEEGTVEMETVVRYAVILHGPFVYSAGYKPASVVVYLNLEGAKLQKPLKLMLKHWCRSVEVSGALKLLRAPHTTGEMENFHYIFHEVQGDLYCNTATFTISEPQCLYCVEMEEESQASYNAIAFQKNSPEENLVRFRIQFMCDCLEWNAYLTELLEQKGWEINSHGDGGVPTFSFHDRQITATPHELHGPGWQAAIDGQLSIKESDFLKIKGKNKNAVIAEVRNRRYPPCIYYQVLYTSVAKRRRVPALWRAELQGADVKLFFSCKVLQELVPPDELGPNTAERGATAGNGSHGRRKTRRSRPAQQAVQPSPQAQVVKTDLGSSVAGHTDYLMLFRIHVSRKAARKAKAVLEGLGLDQNTIDACISAHSSNDEEIVQDGLTRWCGGKGTQPPTWNVLIAAMDYADIAQQDIEELKRKLGH